MRTRANNTRQCQRDLASFDNETTLLSIPNSIKEFNSKILYNSYMTLESQLSRIDSEREPEIYTELDTVTQSIFDSWLALGYRREGGQCSESSY